MLISTLNHQFLPANHLQFDHQKIISMKRRKRRTIGVIECCLNKPRKNTTFYEVLGVPLHSTAQEIKDAYRRLQKRYHPDIAGEKGHENTLKLNQAYEVLMRDQSRKEYDESIGKASEFPGGGGFVGSKWVGPVRPQALFVDENSCVDDSIEDGLIVRMQRMCSSCRNTFEMDEAFGTARVIVQFGDDEDKITTSVDSCPVNCIHWVDSEELQALEYLTQPQPKSGHGVFGQGWERPKNVFLAAKTFNKRSKEEVIKKHKHGGETEETRAQAQAREAAYMEQRIGSFIRIWTWMTKSIGL